MSRRHLRDTKARGGHEQHDETSKRIEGKKAVAGGGWFHGGNQNVAGEA
jgi:hypothetical protein